MLNQETKQKIDSTRDILVGKVPDPKSQVEQITTALIYKFMDDMDKEAEELGGRANFFSGEFARYAWTKLFDPKLSGQQKLDLYVQAISNMPKNPHIPQLFRDIFKGAFLPYNDPRALSLFLKEINEFNYEHSEDLGDAFEYLLSVLGSQGDAGQFRTPRHIIDFIVEAVDPKKNETILDPACGTAGFLISAYKHILKTNQEKPLTPDEKLKLMNNLAGYDISPDMVKLALVNMYLHGSPNPKIYEYDTLSSEKRWDETFDVVLANPPFMTSRGGIIPHKRFSVQSNHAEVLFVDYIVEHLNINGRAGIIVPEGIIFQSNKTYVNLRKKLVEDGLFAVISLPNGIFKPYTDVKTSILLFDKNSEKRRDELLFITIDQDGFEFGAQRKKTEHNDLPKSINILNEWRKGKKVKTDKVEWIKRDKILQNENCILIGNYYQENNISQNPKSFSMVELNELVKEKSKRVKGENIEVWSVSNKKGFVKSEDYFSKKVASENISNYKIVDGHNFAYNPSRINVGSIALNASEIQGAVSPMYVVFEVDESKIVPEFLFILLKSNRLREEIDRRAYGAVRKQLRFSDLQKIVIPLPPLAIQKEIIKEIKAKKDAIESAKQTIAKIEREREYFGASLRKIEGIEWVELGEILDYEQPTKYIVKSVNYSDDYSTPVLTAGKTFILGYTNEEEYVFSVDKLPVIIFDDFTTTTKFVDFPFKVKSSAMKILKVKKAIADIKFVYFSMQNIKFKPSQHKRFWISEYSKIKIPLPSLKIQKRLVAEAEEEQEIIDANKRLIEIMEEKIEKVLKEI